MLDRLLEYSRKHGLVTEPGFAPKDVKWAIECDSRGRFLEVHQLGDVGDRRNPGQRFLVCPELSQPELVGGREARSHFLVESAAVVALHEKEDEEKEKVARDREKHTYFVRLLREASRVVTTLRCVAELLDDQNRLQAIQGRLKERGAKPTDRVTVRIGDDYPVESEAWHQWWRAFRTHLSEEAQQPVGPTGAGHSGGKMRCFATGELVAPAPTHLKISGLADVGGQPSGDALVCFDKEAFASYGLEQSANGAVSEGAAASYRAALNDLLRNHCQRFVAAKVVHWFKERVEVRDDPILLLETPEQEERGAQNQAREVLGAVRKGRRPGLVDNRYYALTLSGAAGRVMVRDWMEGPFEELAGRIEAWFEDLSIVRRDGGGLAPDPKFLAVLGATVRELKDLPSPFVAKIWRAAVACEPIPCLAAAQALSRVELDFIQGDPPNHARMGLLKGYLIRAPKGGASMGPYLNEDHPHPAYHCGRLMSVLADLQYNALGDVGAGVVQRYYAAASATPGLVLGRLLRTAQFHIGKSSYPGIFQGKIAAICARIKDEVPATLGLEEQALFALGYYQQMAEDRRAAREAKGQDSQQKGENR